MGKGAAEEIRNQALDVLATQSIGDLGGIAKTFEWERGRLIADFGDYCLNLKDYCDQTDQWDAISRQYTKKAKK